MFTTSWNRIRALRQRRRVARELDEELQFHIEMEMQAHIARGVPPTEARRMALRDFGGVAHTRELVAEVRTASIEILGRDAWQACRRLLWQPSTTLAAIGMLALAIGITTAMFTLVDALLLRPIPFPAPEQLALVAMRGPTGGRGQVAPAVLREWRRSAVFAGAEGAIEQTVVVDVDGAPAVRQMARVSPGLFDMLGGVEPTRGRFFDTTEGRPDADDQVLLSEDVWRSLFHADTGILGRRITVNSESVVVVGVLPADFRFPSWNTAIWRALDFDAVPPARAELFPVAYVRFLPGVPHEDALRAATTVAHGADAGSAKLTARAQELGGMVLDSYYQRAIPLLAGGVVLVFFVLCANVSGLLLARLSSRQREFRMCAALGAARGRLLRQAFLESCAIGVSGIAAGAAVAWTLATMARVFLPEAFLLRTLNPLDMDARALVVTSLAGVAATFMAGLLPAWVGTRLHLGRSLHENEPAPTQSRSARVTTRALLVGEIALACVLLAAAAQLVKTFVNMATAERGLDTANVFTLWLTLPQGAFGDRPARLAVASAIEERLRQLPQVAQVANSYGTPPEGGGFSFGDWFSDIPNAPPVNTLVHSYSVTPAFFSLYRIPLLKGRVFEAGRDEEVVIGERLARLLWGSLDPVGRTFRWSRSQFQVVGVVREIHHPSLDPEEDLPEFYGNFNGAGVTTMISVRCNGPCPSDAVFRQQVALAHPAVSVWKARTVDDAYFEALARPRAAAALAIAYAAIAILAAAGGLFSVLTYAVSRRRREFGIRTALGASPRQLAQIVAKDSTVVAILGVAIGSGLAWPMSRAIASLQYGVTIGDPITWAVVGGVLILATVLASIRPAREAMRADPVQLLKTE